MSPVGARVAYAVLLLALEAVLTVLGWSTDAGGALAVVDRWSEPTGVLLMLLLLAATARHSRSVVAVVAVLAGVRVVAVVVALAVVGADNRNGYGDGNYVLPAFLGVVVALAGVVVAVSVRRVVR